MMKVNLDDLLAEYVRGDDSIPVAFIFHERNDPTSGIDVAIFCYWAFTRSLLSDETSKSMESAIQGVNICDFEALVTAIQRSIGDSIYPTAFNGRGRVFALRYLRPGWQYRYHTDLDALYPHISEYSERPQSNDTFQSIFELLDERLKQSEAK